MPVLFVARTLMLGLIGLPLWTDLARHAPSAAIHANSSFDARQANDGQFSHIAIAALDTSSIASGAEGDQQPAPDPHAQSQAATLKEQKLTASIPLAAPLAVSPLKGTTNTSDAHSVAGNPANAPSLVDALENTEFGQLFRGKKTLSPSEAVRLEFWLNAIKDLIYAAVAFLPRMMVAMMFFMIFWVLYRGVRRVVLGSMAKAHVDTSIRDMLGAVLKWVIMGFGLVIACNQVGIQITALLTGVSIIGLAIGFAAQETLANFIAGIVIFWDKPFKVGDWLDVDNKHGRVLRITFRSTRLLSKDGEVIILPNTSVLAQRVTNHSTNPLQRINVTIGPVFRGAIDASRAALLSTIRNDTRILRDPTPLVVVSGCSDANVTLLLRFWIRDESIEKEIEHEYLEKAAKAFEAAGIVAPIALPAAAPSAMPTTAPATPSAAATPVSASAGAALFSAIIGPSAAGIRKAG